MDDSQSYPRCMHHYSGKLITVKNAEQEIALGGGWARTPHEWFPYQGPRQPEDRHDPLKWVDQWVVYGIEECRQKLKAQLLRAHADFWKAPDAPDSVTRAMSAAFDGVARVLFDARLLREKLLDEDIPLLVWEAAIAGGWWRFASQTRQNMFPTQLGHYWVWLDDSRNWKLWFSSEAAAWKAELLESPEPISHPAAHQLGEPRRGIEKPIVSTLPRARSWEDVSILFLSDERVQNRIAQGTETANYAEMGFADRRTGKPDSSWAVLRFLAERGGLIPVKDRGAKDWAAHEKQIARTRRLLKDYFRISENPLPFETGIGYRLRCKIECAPSFDK